MENSKETHPLFTEDMKKTHKILMPQMAPYHFGMLADVIRQEGYNLEILNTDNQNLINEGLKYVHNDTCVPALFVIGQLMDAVKSGLYDKDKIALIITQTGGGCRASNYIHLLRKALKKSGMGHVPVISLNISGLEKGQAFSLTKQMTFNLLNALVLGDLLMQLVNETKPYEVNKGDAENLFKTIETEYREILNKGNGKFRWKKVSKFAANIIKRFDNISVKMTSKPKIGIVGEIYVKFSPLGNNNLEQFLEDEGCEVVLPPFMDFVLFKLDYRALEVDLYGGKKMKKVVVRYLMKFLEKRRNVVRSYLKKTRFHSPISFKQLRELVEGYVGHGNRMGEGWLLTAEMIELIKMDVPNIVCTQPFGCLPNHISGKGMFKIIKNNYPEANIIPIDYDTSASEVNQVNRLKLMLANARRMLKINN